MLKRYGAARAALLGCDQRRFTRQARNWVTRRKPFFLRLRIEIVGLSCCVPAFQTGRVQNLPRLRGVPIRCVHEPSMTTRTCCSTPTYDFKNRLRAEPDYFNPKSERRASFSCHFVPDGVKSAVDRSQGARGGRRPIRFNMAKGSMSSHISQFPVGTYKKAHSHGPSAHVIILTGDGYSLMWRKARSRGAMIGSRHADRATQTNGSTSISIRGRRPRAISPSNTRLR